MRAKKSPALFQSASNAGVLKVVMLPLLAVLAQSCQARLSFPPWPSPVCFVPLVGMVALQSRGAAPPLLELVPPAPPAAFPIREHGQRDSRPPALETRRSCSAFKRSGVSVA